MHRWVANSNVVRQRIQDCYGVAAEDISVVFPPVDMARFAAGTPALPGLLPGSYDLVLSALVPYKRIDLAVALQRSNEVAVLLGLGDGRFLTPSTIPAGTWPAAVAGGLAGDADDGAARPAAA